MGNLKVLNLSFVALVPSLLLRLGGPENPTELGLAKEGRDYLLSHMPISHKKRLSFSEAEARVAKAYLDVVGYVPSGIEKSRMVHDFAGNLAMKKCRSRKDIPLLILEIIESLMLMKP